MPDQYLYRTSIKSSLSDEIVNTYLLRPIAGLFVRLLYYTPVTPNQITIIAVLAGIAAAASYANGTIASVAAGGLLVTLKDLLDSADGQLARAKSLYSRAGRFLDSLGDVLVNMLVFSAIGWSLYRTDANINFLLLAAAGFVGITLRVSYHVFYQASYLHLEGKYERNRIIEEITEKDRRGNPGTLILQRIFVLVYGWQDGLMLRIDEVCRKGEMREGFRQRWYGDPAGLRISGLLGLGTELLILTLCSLFNRLEWYLVVNVLLMNGVMLASIAYRRWVLFPKIISSGGIS